VLLTDFQRLIRKFDFTLVFHDGKLLFQKALLFGEFNLLRHSGYTSIIGFFESSDSLQVFSKT
jgi:hypothetical protein